MKLQTGLSECGKILYLVVNSEGQQMVIDLTTDSASQLMALLFELIKEARATQALASVKSEDPV